MCTNNTKLFFTRVLITQNSFYTCTVNTKFFFCTCTDNTILLILLLGIELTNNIEFTLLYIKFYFI